MVLFDSLLAFALTLAALATVVTLLMEFLIRLCGAKRKGQVKLFKTLLGSETIQKLLPDLGKSALEATKAAEPWWRKTKDFLQRTSSDAQGQAAGQQGQEAPPGKEEQPAEPAAYWTVIRGILENPLSSKAMASSEEKQRFLGTSARGVYREVSLEHVLRRLLEAEAAKDLVSTKWTELEPKLQAIARRYDELSSALGADFKRRAQLWSILIGIALAVVMNADGTRLLQTFLQDADLRKAAIEKLSPPDAAEKKDADSTPANAEETVKKLGQELSLINELALPMGNGYFPHCFYFQDDKERKIALDPLCRTEDSLWRFRVWLTWLVKVLFTGVLIGLGAPFWYDVARRLAEVRTAFNGTASSEERHRGADGAGSQDARDMLIERIAKDAADDAGNQPVGAAEGAPG